MKTLTPAQYRAMHKAPKRAKYGNKKVVVDGITFDSRREAKRYEELRDMQARGEISGLELQPRFVLQPAFRHPHYGRCKDGRPRSTPGGSLTYIADFAYTMQSGVRVVEDVKGMKTEAYNVKLRLFLALNPDVTFLEVK